MIGRLGAMDEDGRFRAVLAREAPAKGLHARGEYRVKAQRRAKT